MKSPHGRRLAICTQTGFSWEFIHHGIAWSLLQRGLVDQPSYDSDTKAEDKELSLTDESPENILNFINANYSNSK